MRGPGLAGVGAVDACLFVVDAGEGLRGTVGVSYAWHDSEGARLAYTQLEGETSRLLTVKADLNPVPVVDLPNASAVVVGWGDWGWAIQQGPDEIVLLTPDGAFKDSEVGVAIATHESGLAQCWSEATWACQGPWSADCGGSAAAACCRCPMRTTSRSR